MRRKSFYAPNVKTAPAPCSLLYPLGASQCTEKTEPRVSEGLVTSMVVTEFKLEFMTILVSLSSILLIHLASCPLPFCAQAPRCLARGMPGG